MPPLRQRPENSRSADHRERRVEAAGARSAGRVRTTPRPASAAQDSGRRRLVAARTGPVIGSGHGMSVLRRGFQRHGPGLQELRPRSAPCPADHRGKPGTDPQGWRASIAGQPAARRRSAAGHAAAILGASLRRLPACADRVAADRPLRHHDHVQRAAALSPARLIRDPAAVRVRPADVLASRVSLVGAVWRGGRRRQRCRHADDRRLRRQHRDSAGKHPRMARGV